MLKYAIRFLVWHFFLSFTGSCRETQPVFFTHKYLTSVQCSVYRGYMDAAFWTDHRAFLVSTITNLRTVILKLSTNPRASYSIDTGQGKETVTAASLSMLRNLMNGYIAELQQIDDDLAGTGDPVHTRPGW